MPAKTMGIPNIHVQMRLPQVRSPHGRKPLASKRFQVDGQDVLAVNELAQKLVLRCRKGEGPFFVELETYRYHGHHVGDINREYYRSKAEEKQWHETRDPITNFGKWLTSEGISSRS